MKKNAIILGMARSGTSLAASILARQGYTVAGSSADALQKPNKYNPSGYWESRALMDNNIEILSLTGFRPDNTWFHEAITPGQVDHIARLEPLPHHMQFVESFERQSPWLWKDPRLCYTLDYWWPLLDRETTRVLHVTRDAGEIFRSFQRVADDWHVTVAMEEAVIRQRIDEHRESAARILAKHDIPHLTIDYAEYESAPGKVAAEISELLEISLKAEDLGFDRNAVANFESSPVQRVKTFLKGLLKPG